MDQVEAEHIWYLRVRYAVWVVRPQSCSLSRKTERRQFCLLKCWSSVRGCEDLSGTSRKVDPDCWTPRLCTDSVLRNCQRYQGITFYLEQSGIMFATTTYQILPENVFYSFARYHMAFIAPSLWIFYFTNTTCYILSHYHYHWLHYLETTYSGQHFEMIQST